MQAFDEFDRLVQESDFEQALDFLEQTVREQQHYAALFEVLKMKTRHRLGLSVLYQQRPDQLSNQQQRQLEDGLLSACREVGTLLMEAGDLQTGWMYLQPVGDRDLNERLIKAQPVTDDTIDMVIEIAVTQGAAPGYGYQLLLQHHGTCNGITAFDTQAGMYDRPVQREMAEVLVNHLYEELLGNIRYALQQAEDSGEISSEETGDLLELMQRYPEMTAKGAHHIDTTHLASVMRIGRLAEEPSCLDRAYQMAKYGGQLHPDFQYAGQPPFENTYEDHLHYYAAVTGNEVDAAIDHFREKVKTIDSAQYGPIAIETLVDLLVKVNRNEEALTLSMEQLLGQHAPLGIAPDPLSIVSTETMRQRLMQFYRQRDDLVSYAACWAKRLNEQ